MGIFSGKWPFFISGVALAVVFVGSIYVLNDTVGMGQGLKTISGFFVKTIEDEAIGQRPPIDYSILFLVGLVIGGFLAAIFSGNFKIQLIADYGSSLTMRAFKSVVGGFLGGFFIMIGMMIAEESIYGEIVASIQLSGGAWLYLLSLVFTGSLLSLIFDSKNSTPPTEK